MKRDVSYSGDLAESTLQAMREHGLLHLGLREVIRFLVEVGAEYSFEIHHTIGHPVLDLGQIDPTTDQ